MSDLLAVNAVDVTKTYGALTAVDNITVQVAQGEVYGVLGPNGAGKTTFLRMLFGLIRPAAGSTELFGRTVVGGGARTGGGRRALTLDGLFGLFGPPTMPMALRQKIAADIKEVMENDAIIKDRLNATAQLFAPGGPEEFAKSIDGQRALIAKNAKDLGIPEKP